MAYAHTFDEVLEAADTLSTDEQEDLVSILRRRLIERRRQRLAEEVVQARSELAAGECRPATPEEILSEILS